MKATVRIFLSYASEDQQVVADLYDKLKQARYEPWMNTKDIYGGEPWRLSVEQAIKESDFFIVCLSKHSVAKRGPVQQEIQLALEMWRGMMPRDIFLIPIRLDESPIPDHLSHQQGIDLFEEDGFERILEALEEGLRRRGEEPVRKDVAHLGSGRNVLPTRRENPLSGLGKIVVGDRFVGRSAALREIHDAYVLPRKGRPLGNLALIGLRRIGKSSLVYNAIMEHKAALIKKKRLPVWINVPDCRKSKDLFYSMVRETMQTLKEEDVLTEDLEKKADDVFRKRQLWNDTYTAIRTFFKVVHSKEFHIITILDDFGHVQDLFGNRISEFNKLRSLPHSPKSGISFIEYYDQVLGLLKELRILDPLVALLQGGPKTVKGMHRIRLRKCGILKGKSDSYVCFSPHFEAYVRAELI